MKVAAKRQNPCPPPLIHLDAPLVALMWEWAGSIPSPSDHKTEADDGTSKSTMAGAPG